MTKFSDKQKDCIKGLVDIESSRSNILHDIMSHDIERELFKGLSGDEILQGLDDMVEAGILTEGIPQNEYHCGCIIVTEWKPNTSDDIRMENDAVRKDPQKYERARRRIAEEERQDQLVRERQARIMQERINCRNKWLEDHE